MARSMTTTIAIITVLGTLLPVPLPIYDCNAVSHASAPICVKRLLAPVHAQ